MLDRGGPEPLPPVREGLPPTFRMRADKHYVDLLDAPPPPFRIELIAVAAIEPRESSGGAPAALVESVRRHGILQPLLVQARNRRYRLMAGGKRLAAASAAGLREVPCIVRHVDDEAARDVADATNVFAAALQPAQPPASESPVVSAAADALERTLAALGTCASLLKDAQSDLAQGIALDLLRAEAWRAACQLHCLRVLQGAAAARPRAIAVHDVVARVMQAVEPECRVRSIVLDRRVSLSEGRIQADEELLVCALSAAVSATIDLVERGAGAVVTIAASFEPGSDFVFAVRQNASHRSAAWRQQDALDREGGAPLAAARRIVEACGGRVSLSASGHGSEVQVVIPGTQAGSGCASDVPTRRV